MQSVCSFPPYFVVSPNMYEHLLSARYFRCVKTETLWGMGSLPHVNSEEVRFRQARSLVGGPSMLSGTKAPRVMDRGEAA